MSDRDQGITVVDERPLADGTRMQLVRDADGKWGHYLAPADPTAYWLDRETVTWRCDEAMARKLLDEPMVARLILAERDRAALVAAYQKAAPVDLDALDAKVARMTRGPWHECNAQADGACPCGLVWSYAVDNVVGSVKPSGCIDAVNNGMDAIGIAALRNAWPALLAELRQLRAANADRALRSTNGDD